MRPLRWLGVVRPDSMGNGYGGLFALHALFTRSPSEKSISSKLVPTVGGMEQSLSKAEISWPDADEREEHRLKVTPLSLNHALPHIFPPSAE